MIEVVVLRHPDAGTDVTVLVDGVEVTYRGEDPDGAFVTVIDPGVGYTRRDWSQMRADDFTGSSVAARTVIDDAYKAYEGSEFTTIED